MNFAIYCTSSINIYKKNKHLQNIRNTQYINGCKSLIKYLEPYKETCNIDIIYCDNTTKIKPGIIEGVLPSDTKYICYSNNIYGNKNKSAGLIDQFQKISENVDNNKYDYIIHFHPRCLIVDNTFFKVFFKEPCNIFRYRHKKKSYFTGIFSLKSEHINNIAKKCTPNDVISSKGFIEYIIFNYIKKNNIKIKLIDKCDLLRGYISPNIKYSHW